MKKKSAGRKKSSGTNPPADERQCEPCRKWLEDTAKLLEKADRTQETINAAFGLWMGYPSLLEMIGVMDKTAGPTPSTVAMTRPQSCWAAYSALNVAYYHATHFLMAEAERNGLDPFPLHECARVVQELYAAEPWLYYSGPNDTWPECMGKARYLLAPAQQEALRDGEAVFVRLAFKLDVKVDPKTRPTGTELGDGKNNNDVNLSLDEKAVALKVNDPELSVTTIARRLGCSRQQLYNLPKFHTILGILKTGKQELPKGSKDKDGTVEAWQ